MSNPAQINLWQAAAQAMAERVDPDDYLSGELAAQIGTTLRRHLAEPTVGCQACQGEDMHLCPALDDAQRVVLAWLLDQAQGA